MSAIACLLDASAVLVAGTVFSRTAARASIRGAAAFVSFALALASVMFAAPVGVPQWTRFVALATVVVAFYAVTEVLDPIGGEPGDLDDGGEGGGPDVPTGPQRGSGRHEPDWWPAFEREFASYVSARDPVQRVGHRSRSRAPDRMAR